MYGRKWFSGQEMTREWLRKHNFDEITKPEYSGSYNKVLIHSSENFPHFMVKSAIVYQLVKKNRMTLSEMAAKHNGITKRRFDVFDISELNSIGVEDSSKETDVDIVVKLKDMPREIQVGFDSLQKFLNERVP